MSSLKLSGILSKELILKTDKNGKDYFLGWLKIKDGTIRAFFFFDPDYDLSMRLVDLKVNQELTLQGFWSKRSPAFVASDFYLEEAEKEKVFGLEYGL